VAVVGCGGVGLACVNGAAIAGAGRIIAVDRVASKLELAKTFGATDLVNAAETDPVQQVRELTGGGVDYSFEAIGLKQTAEQCFQMLCAGGTATIIGMIPVGTMVSVHGVDFLAEKKLQGCTMGSNRFRVDMPRYIEFYLQGKLHLDEMVSQRLPLAQVNDALDALKQGEVARTVLTFDA
jgi:S-(hydroxymethyl)glutathione dehydrogenase/alcohol dehydrogenase